MHRQGLLESKAITQKISFTRPTSPLSRRTLIPCGWAGVFVRMSLTIPSVSFPVRWSFFNTIETRSPGLMSHLLVPFILNPSWFHQGSVMSLEQQKESFPGKRRRCQLPFSGSCTRLPPKPVYVSLTPFRDGFQQLPSLIRRRDLFIEFRHPRLNCRDPASVLSVEVGVRQCFIKARPLRFH